MRRPAQGSYFMTLRRLPRVPHIGYNLNCRKGSRTCERRRSGLDSAQHTTNNLSLTLHANGRMTHQEIREHAQTIAKAVSAVFNQNPSTRPKY